MDKNSNFRLHFFPESGNSYKVALMLKLCGFAWEPVFVNYFGGVTKSEEWRATVNEMGEVPVLEHDGRYLTQSAVILGYLAELSGAFGARSPDEHRELMRWLFFDNHKFTSYFVTHRFLRAFTKNPDPIILAFLRARVDACFSVVEKHLEARSFIVAERLTIADLSMIGYLYFPSSETGFDLPQSYPNIARWLKRIAEIPGWRDPYELLPGKRFAGG